jgi:hypothetical protein
MPDSHNALCEFPSMGALPLDGFAAASGHFIRRMDKRSGKVSTRTEPYCRVEILILKDDELFGPQFRRCIKLG